jgi:predicted secreted hydrolase
MPREPDRSSIQLPHADGVQPEHPCQWWYWSGQLRSGAGRRYGFQVAFFAAEAVRGVLWGQMAHWAIVDLDAGRFTNGSRIWLGAPKRIEGRFSLASPSGAVEAVGGGGRDRLRLRFPELELDLRACGGPVAEHYGGRAHPYAFGGYSYYYSRPRMRADASLRDATGETHELRGDVWFDRQFGDLSHALVEGWEWLSIHLDSGEQLMVFGFNREVGERFASITDAHGVTRWLGSSELKLESLGHWRSPRSSVEYPCAWRLRADGYDLEIRTAVEAQEMNGARWLGPVYWEGACEVTGSHRGLAYVELLGSLPAWLTRAMRGHGAGPKQLSGALARVLRHPTVTLGLATSVGWAAHRVAGMRPGFAARVAADPSVTELTTRRGESGDYAGTAGADWREAVGQ